MIPPILKLDDRTWDDLIDEAKRRIAVKCPDWTDFNPSDPGMTLVELMAWMTETVLYRLNRVPEKNYFKFLELIGVRLLPAKPARTWVFFQVQTGANEESLAPVPIGTTISTRPQREREPVTFATLRDLNLTSCEIIKTCSRYSASAVRDTGAFIDELEEVHNLCGKNPWETEIFHRPKTDPRRGKAVAHNLYLGDAALGDPVLAKAWQQTALRVQVEIEKPMKGRVFLEWEAWDGEAWQIVAYREDTTNGFHNDGSVLFENLPAMKKRSLTDLTGGQFGDPASTPGTQDEPLWLRARLTGSEADELPTLRGVLRQLDITGCVIPALKALVEAPLPERLSDMPPYSSPLPPRPIETSTDFYPLGVKAVRGSAFYIASELFQKRGAKIAIQFALRKSLQPQRAQVLEIHWEYKSRAGDWQTLGKSTPGESSTTDDQFQDHTRAFTRDGQVRFLCPEDIEQSEVGGQLGWFVRARVERADLEPEGALLVARSVLLGFTNEVRPWAHCLSENYSNFEKHPAGRPFSPFIIKTPQDPAFYVCFDRKPSVARGPYRLFLDVVRQPVVPRAPKMKWEYSAAGGWNPLKADDGTDGFAHEGSLDFIGPADWSKAIEFQQPGYWLRVRWEIAEFITPPRLRSVSLNGVQVEQAAEVERVLGSSDGLPYQVFSVNASILEDPEIWVRESGTLSEEIVAALPLRKEVDGEGGVWVKWQEVHVFYDSKITEMPDASIFVADLDSGTFVFGNGTYGSIPPKGRDNIKARYRVTQGSRGNVGSDTVTVLEKSLPQIQGVRNIHPAEGGSDRETIERAKERGPWELKHGNRAVTEEDFKRLARKASPVVGKAECYEEDGIIRVIVVPDDKEPKPQPSQRLIQDVLSYLDNKRLINTRLEVCGPCYEAIDVEIEIVLETLFRGRFDTVRQLIAQRLHTFVHPLSGMADGSGWPIGRTLHISELYYRLEDLDGVDHVGKLKICKSGTQNWKDAIRIGSRSFPCFSKEMKIEQSFV